MSAHTARSFEVPEALVAAGYGPTVDLDVLDREVEFPGAFGEWAEKVLFAENSKVLADVCGGSRLLPRGILASVQLDDGSALVSGLVDSDGLVWDSASNSWAKPAEEFDVAEGSVILDDDEVAFVARALREGADEVWFRPYIPKAFVSAVVAAPEPPTARDVPNGSAIVAVVDPIDEDAVLEMLAITPGPHVLRRHAGNWFEDPEWVGVLKSVKPPKIVKLDEAQVASVASQVDRTTDEEEWEPFSADAREQYQIFTASAGAVDVDDEVDADEKEMFDALVAVAGRELSPDDIADTERLKRYWTVGPGAAKIRWGTPGAWSRCYRNVVKYMRPDMAKGYCTNLSQRLGGQGIATHVAASAEAVKKSPYLQELQNEGDERALFSLVAVAGRQLTPKDAVATERLKRYWTVGRGAAKIRWGTPGSWRRCYRHLVKYVGPKIAPGYCTNLSQRLGGHGVATHVGMDASAEPVTAANPSGTNGYDKGMSFEESTGGVQRDSEGQFAPEGGSTRGQRRKGSVYKSSGTSGKWDESRAKFKIRPNEKKASKAEAEKNRAIEKAQREELAAMSVQIAELRAQGKDIEAAQLRVEYAQKALSFSETPTKRYNAQAALVNAQTALSRAIRAKRDREAREAKRAKENVDKSPTNGLYEEAVARQRAASQ